MRKSRAPIADEPFTNSLSQRFVTAGTPGVMFCVWETRVRDFEAFVKETQHWVQPGYDINEGGVWIKNGAQDWRAPPGYVQTKDHPVIGIGWNDAIDFCVWLTAREREAGLIGRGDVYRLPNDVEWSIAAGLPPDLAGKFPAGADDITGIYPWGNEFPPPARNGNYAGEEMRDFGWPESVPVIAGFRDKHTGPAPVGIHSSQRYGLFDLGGNVAEWTLGTHPQRPDEKLVRGGSWATGNSAQLRSACRWSWSPDLRNTAMGFRIVFVRAAK